MNPDPIDPRFTGPTAVHVTDTTIYFTQANLASILHITKQAVSYHLAHLKRAGKLRHSDIIIRPAATRSGAFRQTVHYPLPIALALADRLRTFLPVECAAGLREQIMTTYPQYFPNAG